MAANNKRKKQEWIGSLVSMPAYVTGEGEPYRPEALFWMDAEGAVQGHTVGKPGELVSLAADSLRSALERPMLRPAHTPARVRVASPELAEALRTAHAGLEIVCAPTPEIDAVIASLREMMDEDGEEADLSYLSSELGPDAIGAFFHSAAGLYRAQPWEIVPSDDDLLSVTIESLGVRDAALSIIGHMGQSVGFVLFPSLEDFEAFLEATDAIERGEAAAMPQHFALNFEPGAQLSPALRKEVLQHRWEVAGSDAYPWVLALDEDVIPRAPTAKEVTVTEVVALALTKLLEEKAALLAACNGYEVLERTLRVAAYAGEYEVRFRVPYEHESTRHMPPNDVMAALLELEREGDEIDDEQRRVLEDELMRHFVRSPEAIGLSNVQLCRFILDFGASHFGATIATLEASELEEIIFEIIPEKVSIDSSEASAIIAANRAFYSFLKRELGLKQADACLRVLDGDAVEQLEAALSDSSNFGMAKSMFMRGREAGVDVGSKEGIERWLRGLSSPSILRPSGASPRSGNRVAARAKNKKRKAERKARRKNR
jgi:hypothetical protein